MELILAVQRITRFLDNIGTANVFPNEKFQKRYEEYRPIGVGVMGVADAMLKLKLQYGSKESLIWFDRIMTMIQRYSYKMSEEIGQEKGIPTGCQHVNRRNITVQSIAPTGSIAIISECSHGIEPIFSPSYTRIDERGNTYQVVHPLAEEQYFTSCIGHKNSPSVQSHLDILALTQKYVDSGVSKTINLPHEATIQDVKDAFIWAWKNGIKGITVYRDGSREFQVLNDNKKEIPTEEDAAIAACPSGVCVL